jgi:alpha-tubulin suppressor-like RCC1 family protein/uncharacterized protein YkwD
VAAEASVRCLINEERAGASVPAPPLTLNLKLRDAARLHANDAKTLKWWAGGGPEVHINPLTGSTPQDRIKAAGYCPKEATPPTGENAYHAWFQGGIQFATNTTPQAAVTAWMNSPGHRDNLLNATFNETGVAVVLGIAEKGTGADFADGGAIFVQTFGGCDIVDPPILGEVWDWGKNDRGQLGDSTTTTRLTPVQPTRIEPVMALDGGGFHSLALMSDGTVSAWGANEFGTLGDGTTTDRLAPVPVASLDNVKVIACGWWHNLALTSDGRVWAWGSNNNGQLGDGTINEHHTPVPVPNLQDVIAIAAGYFHNLALLSDGSVMAWGANSTGKLGNGTTTDQASPVPVPNLRDVVAISAGGDHSLALKSDGSVWAWGENSSGQLGDQTLIPKFTPVQVKMPEQLMFSPVVAIAAGGAHSLALEQNGQVWAWGGNAFGQIGNGDTIDRWLPVMPLFMQEVTAIAAGFGHSLVVKRDRTVRVWGANSSGQLGDNTTMDRHTSVQVTGLPDISHVAAGTHHSLAIFTEG